ncbi:hypothetical protein [Saccharopolyspora hattusasensis]|uniref:hypothetical protein n=1 Tax=Saccharopolyspora hattusasensis TaxID=1128679 RepID=UPI003D9841C4
MIPGWPGPHVPIGLLLSLILLDSSRASALSLFVLSPVACGVGVGGCYSGADQTLSAERVSHELIEATGVVAGAVAGVDPCFGGLVGLGLQVPDAVSCLSGGRWGYRRQGQGACRKQRAEPNSGAPQHRPQIHCFPQFLVFGSSLKATGGRAPVQQSECPAFRFPLVRNLSGRDFYDANLTKAKKAESAPIARTAQYESTKVARSDPKVVQ